MYDCALGATGQAVIQKMRMCLFWHILIDSYFT